MGLKMYNMSLTRFIKGDIIEMDGKKFKLASDGYYSEKDKKVVSDIEGGGIVSYYEMIHKNAQIISDEKTQSLTTVTRKDRVAIINKIMNEIAGRGRKFFYHEGKIAEIVDKGRIYYKAEYGDKQLLCLNVPDYRKPKGWFHGGTLLHLVKEFRDFIKDGRPTYCSVLHSPHWGYPDDDMKAIRNLALELGYLTAEK